MIDKVQSFLIGIRAQLDEINKDHDEPRFKDVREAINLFLHEVTLPDTEVTDPRHYNRHKIQSWDVCIAWGVNYLVGCTIKYIARLGAKDTELNELRKAATYLEKQIRSRRVTITFSEPSHPAAEEVTGDWRLQGHLAEALKHIYRTEYEKAFNHLGMEIKSWEFFGRGSTDAEVEELRR